jgi:hypothetical protein
MFMARETCNAERTEGQVQCAGNTMKSTFKLIFNKETGLNIKSTGNSAY